jgi:Zn-dependent protease
VVDLFSYLTQNPLQLLQFCLSNLLLILAIIIIHELGHATMASIYKYEVIVTSFGSGEVWVTVGKLRFKNLFLFFKENYCYWDLPKENRNEITKTERLRCGLIAAGGPIGNSIFALILWVISIFVQSDTIKWGLYWWIGLSLLIAVVNLIPKTKIINEEKFESDGAQILKYIRAPESVILDDFEKGREKMNLKLKEEGWPVE